MFARNNTTECRYNAPAPDAQNVPDWAPITADDWCGDGIDATDFHQFSLKYLRNGLNGPS